MALRGEVVNLLGANLLHEAAETIRVREVAVVESKPLRRFVGILVEVVEPPGIEGRASPNDSVDLVTLREKELSEIAAVLARDSSN